MSGSNGQRPPRRAIDGGRSPIERPNARKGTDSPEDVQRYLNALVATRVFGEAPEAVAESVEAERAADEVEALQKRSAHADPDRHRGPGERPKDLNRHMRRVRAKKKAMAKVVAATIERARKEGADPNWTPEAFPALDWRIKSEVWTVLRDVSGRRARIFAAALPPAQGEQLVQEAKRIALEAELEEGYATVRWRELVAGAWVSWRLSRPIRARTEETKDDGHTRLGDYVLGLVPPDPDDWQPPAKRENPWAGGRVVDGYARQAFALLMRDVATGAPMSISKLFYRNGSGQQGVFGYLATPAPETRASKLPRIDGVLGLYSRWQPRADKSKYVGPPKKGPDGKPLLDANGHVQRYALCEHWYHRDMCGRRAVAQADRGGAESRSLLRELCPWLFAEEATAKELTEESEERAAAVDGPEAPSPAVSSPSSEDEAPSPRSRGPD